MKRTLLNNFERHVLYYHIYACLSYCYCTERPGMLLYLYLNVQYIGSKVNVEHLSIHYPNPKP